MRLSVDKPQTPAWLLAAFNHCKNNPEMLVKGSRHWQRVAELFPNMQLGDKPTTPLPSGE